MANEEHVAILKKGVKEWNQWRKDNLDVKPDLSFANLDGANLSEADLSFANLCEADFFNAKLIGVDFMGADLKWANFLSANLSGTNLIWADLVGADFSLANLSGAQLSTAKLQSTDFSAAIVDGETLLDEGCEVDRETTFAMVGLGDTRIDSGIRQLLEYNMRRRQWKKWCYPSPWWKMALMFPFGVLTHLFWLMSDYGKSTLRIIISFFALALIFAVLYWRFDGWLIVDGADGITDFLHACYFSIVTMTTLGFGDIHASPNSHCGQIVLMGQVLLGYIMLGALVTRFAVLFTAGGPAAKFTKMDKMTKAKLKEIKKRQQKENKQK